MTKVLIFNVFCILSILRYILTFLTLFKSNHLPATPIPRDGASLTFSKISIHSTGKFEMSVLRADSDQTQMSTHQKFAWNRKFCFPTSSAENLLSICEFILPTLCDGELRYPPLTGGKLRHGKVKAVTLQRNVGESSGSWAPSQSDLSRPTWEDCGMAKK